MTPRNVPASHVLLERDYAAADGRDGTRILVDCLWPRGVSKARAALDSWDKAVAPSTELRRWFGHDPARWQRFRDIYKDELAGNAVAVEALRVRALAWPITLLYGARDEVHNEAIALRTSCSFSRRQATAARSIT